MAKKTTLKRWLIRISISALVVYVVCFAALICFQRTVLYPGVHTYTPLEQANAPKAFQEIFVTTQDGLKLTGWYAPATSKKLTLVFFHGNADSLRSMAPLAAPYINEGYGFLLTEYRGYSGNPGHPTEDGLYSDARAFVKALIATGVPENQLVLYGHSLGTGVATQMATEFKAAGLMLEAPYLSVAKMAQIRFPIFPAEYFALDRYESFKKIPTIHMPVFIAHGEWDIVVPFRHGHALYEMANDPKTFFDAPQGGHSDLAQHGFVEASMKWLDGLQTYLATAVMHKCQPNKRSTAWNIGLGIQAQYHSLR